MKVKRKVGRQETKLEGKDKEEGALEKGFTEERSKFRAVGCFKDPLEKEGPME